MFYEFNQNNSGGSFVVNDKLCHRVVIEADTLKEAVWKAEELGCYWDGVTEGIDCECCGDRWYIPFDAIKLPDSYTVGGYNCKSKSRWMHKYGKYTIKEHPQAKTGMFGTFFEGKISFKCIEDYVQFLANEYGWTTPDAKIYYKDGNVKEIYSQREEP